MPEPTEPPTLTERMQANIEAGMPDCPDGEHVWFGSFGIATCAVCLLTSEEFYERREASDA